MAMKLVKKTAEYSIYKRGDDRYAVKDANKNPVNAEEKVRILVAEGFISAPVPPQPRVEDAAEEGAVADEPAEEAPTTAGEEAPAEEAAVEEGEADAEK